MAARPAATPPPPRPTSPGGVTWADIYDSPEVDRSLRRLPRLCREAVQLVWAAGRRGTGAGQVLPQLLLPTVLTAAIGFLSAIARSPSSPGWCPWS